jgi:hypothetical protein
MTPEQAQERLGKISAIRGGNESECHWPPYSTLGKAWLKGFRAETTRQQRNASGTQYSTTARRCMEEIARRLK